MREYSQRGCYLDASRQFVLPKLIVFVVFPLPFISQSICSNCLRINGKNNTTFNLELEGPYQFLKDTVGAVKKPIIQNIYNVISHFIILFLMLPLILNYPNPNSKLDQLTEP